MIRVIMLIMLSCALVYADETIVDYSNTSLSILNEELRKNNKDTRDIKSDISTINSAISAITTSQIIKISNYQTGEMVSGSVVIPYDDTIPQISEGFEFMSIDFTPASATNKLKIDVVFYISQNANNTLTVSLFKSGTNDALASGFLTTSTNYAHEVTFTHYMTAGTTSTITFSVRAGDSIGHQITMNGINATRYFGGSLASSITITEIKA